MVISSFALAGHGAFTFSGSYRWLAELQMRMIGEYYPNLTFLFAGLLLTLPLFAALQIARKLGVIADTGETVEQRHHVQRVEQERWAKRQPAFVLLCIGGGLAWVGGRDWIVAARGRTLERLEVGAIEHGETAQGTWLEAVEGMPREDAAVQWQEGASTTTFMPIVSAEWRPSQPIALVVMLDSFQAKQLGSQRGAFRGALDLAGLPSAVQAVFRDRQLDTSRALLLELGKNPANDETKATVLFSIGIVCLLAGVVVGVWRLRQERA